MKRFVLFIFVLALFVVSHVFASSGSAYTARSSKWNKDSCEYNGLEVQGAMGWVQTEKESSFTVKMVERDEIDDVEVFVYIGDSAGNLPHGVCGVLWLTASAGNALLKFKQMVWNEGYHWVGMQVPCPSLAGVATSAKKSEVELYYNTYGNTGTCPSESTTPTSTP
jgi:hypothetical protein